MYDLFFLLGVILLFGFFSSKVFERTGISQVLLLMLAGFVVGPLLNIVDVSAGSVLAGISGFMAVLALIILLFDGGLGFDAFDVLKAAPTAFSFTTVTFVLTLASSSAVLVLGFGWQLSHALLLGATVGGSCSSIVLAMVHGSKASGQTRALLAIESTITDAYCLIVAFSALKFIVDKNPSFDGVPSALVGSLTTGLFVGALMAAAWFAALSRLRGEKPYMLTLSIAFIVYALSEFSGGNGGLAVFAFGLVLGNGAKLAAFFKLPAGDYRSETEIRSVQSEVTFFVRTFFFVYLGSIMSLKTFSGGALLLGGALLFAIIAARRLAVGLFSGLIAPEDKPLVSLMLPRGLAAAVLATYVASNGVAVPFFTESVLLVILSTNLIATAGLFASLRGRNVSPPGTSPAVAGNPAGPRVVSVK